MCPQAGKAAGGKENAYNGPDSGNSQTDGKGTNHPLPVQGNLTSPDMPESFAQSQQEKPGKQYCTSRLINTTNSRHGKAHHQCR